MMGSIDLASSVFPAGTPDTRLDILARRHLLKAGLNYRHGTGHGIGVYGNIHESPIQVRVYAKEEHPIQEGYFFSDEPGYYQPDQFGIRLETVVYSVNETQLSRQTLDDYGPMLGLRPAIFVPFEPKLIDYDLLSGDQIEWLNEYNAMCRQIMGHELDRQGKELAKAWMMERTVAIPRRGFCSESLKVIKPLEFSQKSPEDNHSDIPSSSEQKLASGWLFNIGSVIFSVWLHIKEM